MVNIKNFFAIIHILSEVAIIKIMAQMNTVRVFTV